MGNAKTLSRRRGYSGYFLSEWRWQSDRIISRVVGFSLLALPLLYGGFLLLTHNLDVDGARRQAEYELMQAQLAGTSGLPIDAFFRDPRYILSISIAQDLRILFIASAVGAFIVAALAGSLDWTSRTIHASFVYRGRPAVLPVRVGVVALWSFTVTFLAGTLGVAAFLLVAVFRGETSNMTTELWLAVALYLIRGATAVGLLAVVGVCLGMLLRSPITVLAVALAYMVAIEAAFRAIAPGAQAILLSAAISGAVEPLAPLTTPTGPCVGAGCDPPATLGQVTVALVTLVAVGVVLFLAAQYSNVRRDIR